MVVWSSFTYIRLKKKKTGVDPGSDRYLTFSDNVGLKDNSSAQCITIHAYLFSASVSYQVNAVPRAPTYPGKANQCNSLGMTDGLLIQEMVGAERSPACSSCSCLPFKRTKRPPALDWLIDHRKLHQCPTRAIVWGLLRLVPLLFWLPTETLWLTFIQNLIQSDWNWLIIDWLLIDFNALLSKIEWNDW